VSPTLQRNDEKIIIQASMQNMQQATPLRMGKQIAAVSAIGLGAAKSSDCRFPLREDNLLAQYISIFQEHAIAIQV